jgi:WD40 repeat protein
MVPCLCLQKAHEYTRALNAAKLERIFAKPFITSLTHSDGITCLARNPKALNSLLAGTADGGIRIWDIPAKRTLRRLEGHTGAVKGISFAPDGETCVSASTDCTVSSCQHMCTVRLLATLPASGAVAGVAGGPRPVHCALCTAPCAH